MKPSEEKQINRALGSSIARLWTFRENDHNREQVRMAQEKYYSKYVKPYEDRGGDDVGEDWRNYNEEWVADHSRT